MAELVQINNATKYLLGKLKDEDQVRIEELYFESSSAFEELLIAEHELIDSYVAGRLSREDRKLVEERLLINPAQVEKCKFSRSLQSYAKARPTRSDTEARSWAASLRDILSGYLVLPVYAAAVLLMLGLVGLWVLRMGPAADTVATTETFTPAPVASDERPDAAPPSNSEAETPVAIERTEGPPVLRSGPKPKPPAVPKRTSIFTIVLPMVATRGTSPASNFTVPNTATSVGLSMPVDRAGYAEFFAVVETVDGQQVWSGTAGKGSGSVTAVVPASRLRTGDYVISLKGRGENKVYESVGDYSFTITREKK